MGFASGPLRSSFQLNLHSKRISTPDKRWQNKRRFTLLPSLNFSIFKKTQEEPQLQPTKKLETNSPPQASRGEWVTLLPPVPPPHSPTRQPPHPGLRPLHQELPHAWVLHYRKPGAKAKESQTNLLPWFQTPRLRSRRSASSGH